MKKINNKLKVVIIGGWGHGHSILHGFANNKFDNAELVAMGQTASDEPLMKIPENLNKTNKIITYSNYNKMLKEVKPDVAVVSTKLELINQAAINAAQKGCHLICEKPIATTEKQLKNLKQTVLENRIKCILLLNNRSNPFLQAVRSVVKKDIIGRVVIINARKSYPWYKDRVNKFPINLGGTIGWVGIHALDFINGTTDLFFKKVAGMESNHISSDYADCPDNCGLVFELNNGGHATVSIDYHRPESSKHHGDDWIRIVGTKGTIKSNFSKEKINCCTDELADYKVDIPKTQNLFQEYFSYLTGETKLENKFDQIMQAAFQMTKACIIAQKAVINEKILEIR